MSSPALASPPVRSRGWLDMAEAGSVLGLRIVLFTSRILGRRGARALLVPIVFYYALLHRQARRASRTYLERVGQPSGFGASYTHLLRFAQCALDRLYFLQGRLDLFRVSSTGTEHLRLLRDEKRGAILLGAHLGSFEAMRARGGSADYPINIVGYFRHAAKINSVLERAGCKLRERFVEVEPGSVSFVLHLRDLVERGEMIALMADRIVSGETVEVDFLGKKARLPTGPFVLASMLRCPVYLTFGLHRPPDRYEIHCEPFAERVELPRATRAATLHAHVQRYAERLEHYCMLAPDNWFNFYDFWSERNAA